MHLVLNASYAYKGASVLPISASYLRQSPTPVNRIPTTSPELEVELCSSPVTSLGVPLHSSQYSIWAYFRIAEAHLDFVCERAMSQLHS